MTSRVGFTAALALLVALLLVQSLALAPASRVAPLWVLVPTAVLLLVQLLLDVSPRVRERLRVLQSPGVAIPEPEAPAPSSERARGAGRGILEPDVAARTTARAPDTVHPGSRGSRELRVVFWMAWLMGLMYLVGFLLATALFLLPYLRVESGTGWRRSVVLSAVAAAVTYLAFGVVARVPFPPGVVF